MSEGQTPAATRSVFAGISNWRRPADAAYGVLAVAALGSALALGGYARFKALGAAPLAVDEYFMVRSTQNLLRHGVPVFDCGGIYSRGLMLQYLAALLSLCGMSLDVAARLIGAVSSVLALPAAFILGRRVRGTTLGLLTVAVLALSVWEVEMARFARMYAPFQAVFLWYLVYFLRRAVDNDRHAEWPMIALTVLGALLWEGGALLALANFMPLLLQRPSLALTKREWLGQIKYLAVFAAVYWFVTSDFRMLSPTPALPLDYDPSLTDQRTSANSRSVLPMGADLASYRVWLAFAMVPLLASAAAVRALWRQRAPAVMATGVIVALGAALAHQFLLAAAVLIILPLLRFCSWSQLMSRGARTACLAIGLWAVFWLSLRWVSWSAPGDIGFSKAVLSFLRRW
jgi:hypothetical protein